jgi:phosphohistidine phosphatase
MRDLYLLRHAKSSWDDPRQDDHERPLAPRGVASMKAIAKHLRREGVAPDLVLCSSARRARETLERVLPALGDATIEVEDGLYTFDASILLRRIHRVPAAVRSLMLVGHNPAMQDLAGELAAGGKTLPRLRTKFPTGALATIEIPRATWLRLKPGDAQLRAFVTPKDLTG